MTPAAAVCRLLYLHGFRSSPQSFKALRLQAWLAEHRPDIGWWCPQLPPSPREAMALVDQGLAVWPQQGFAVLGSSLGGFYASVVAERHGCPAVVINPAIDPARDLAPFVGTLSAYHDPSRRFEFRAEYLDELRRLDPGRPSRPARTLAVIAQGDELLDWREMLDRYRDAELRLIEGSDHGLSDFDEHLPHILRFLGLAD